MLVSLHPFENASMCFGSNIKLHCSAHFSKISFSCLPANVYQCSIAAMTCIFVDNWNGPSCYGIRLRWHVSLWSHRFNATYTAPTMQLDKSVNDIHTNQLHIRNSCFQFFNCQTDIESSKFGIARSRQFRWFSASMRRISSYINDVSICAYHTSKYSRAARSKNGTQWSRLNAEQQNAVQTLCLALHRMVSINMEL